MIDKKMAAASAFVIAVGVATGAGMYFIHNGSNATIPRCLSGFVAAK